MIDFLRGRLISKTPTYIVVETGGIGWGLIISLYTYQSLGKEGEDTLIFASLIANQDNIRLFGFGTGEERELFLELVTIPGIGPKLAMRILSEKPTQELKKNIAEQDVHSLYSIKGIGKKTAERLILELSGRLVMTKDTSVSEEAVSALISLGYKRKEAETAVRKALSIAMSKDLEEIIKKALSL
ncbi:MAG: Holliday junction branch migration protein RuvA [bacterium]|nr:Holliday junction branch migration protein RuvA [bacterium]